jgi:GNAT superfamily N-acetyltransferase
MGEIFYREYKPSDAASWLKLHDSVFPPITREYWDQWSAREDVTAVVAVLDGEIVGTVPFHLRDFVIRPGVTIRAAFEYSVCVRDGLRDKGIGTGLMNCAKAVLKDRCDAMMVFRGAEVSPAYNFYLRNEHYDLVFARHWSLVETGSRPTGRVELLPIADLYRREKEIQEVFESAFASCGGYVRRHPGYWQPMIENCNWEEVKHDMRLFLWEREERIIGYAVAGKQVGQDVVTLMEAATCDGDPVRVKVLLNAVVAFAGALQSRVEAWYPESGIYADGLGAVGFQPLSRQQNSMMIMAHPLNAEAIARKAWVKGEALADAEVIAWSPKRTVTLHRAVEPKRRIEIEMKDDLLTRLLFCRLDLVRAWENELVNLRGGPSTMLRAAPSMSRGGGRAEVEAVAAALPFTRWEYQHLEMI